MSVFARSGVIGLGIWALMWWSWFYCLLRSRRRFLARGRNLDADVCAWLVIVATLVLINAVFDPTIESPMVGAWIWTVFGVGLAQTGAAFRLRGPTYSNNNQFARSRT